VTETIIDPDRLIVDAHHHLWNLDERLLAGWEKMDCAAVRALTPVRRSQTRYLLDEFLADARAGHKVCASVYVDAHAMYRRAGPESMRSVGEVEFANGMAAMAASGAFGDVKVCAGIVGNVDLRLGDAVEDVLLAHVQAAGDRYRGIRCAALSAYDADPRILGPGGVQGLLLDDKFRRGFRHLHRLGLSFDAWLLEPQLPELIDLARAFPETQIILNHTGGPIGVGRYEGQREERFPIWRDSIRALARCDNVIAKLGGLGLPLAGFKSFASTPPATSQVLAAEWRPYIETCIEAFGADCCMFESNFPVDARTCTYATLWNAFKLLIAGATEREKNALFSGTAITTYRLEVERDCD
jgi:L-fuconolactonase